MKATRSLRNSLIAASALAVGGVATAHAASISIDSVVGTWENVSALREGVAHGYPTGAGLPKQPPAGTTWESFSPSDGEGSNRIEWGWEYDDGPSAYVFEGPATPIDIPDADGDSGFYLLGQFTHENRTIITGGPRLLSADLHLNIEGQIRGEAFDFTPIFTFTHNETPNAGVGGVCPDGGVVACPDIVTVNESVNSISTFEVGGFTYRAYVEGFVDLDGTPKLDFFTLEYQDNPAFIRWRIEREGMTTPVPLPAGMWLLLSGLGGLAIAARRKRAA